MRKYYFGILIFLLGFGCDLYRNTTNQEVVCGILQEPQILDPARTEEFSVSFIAPNIYETLIKLNPQHLTPEPCLAIDWEIQNAGKDYIFHIRPNVLFHDTTTLNAEAVKVSFDRQINSTCAYYLQPNGGIYSRTMLGMIDSVEVLDSLTVLFRLKYPYAPFLKTLASVFGAAIISPASPESTQNISRSAPKSTGPFQLVHWEPHQKISLAPNENYWNEYPEVSLSFRFFDDAESMIRSFKNSEIDVIFSVPPTLRERFLFDQDSRVHILKTLSTYFLGINCDRPPLNRKLVRQAIRHAIDKRKLIFTVYHGGAHVASNILPPQLNSNPTTTQSHDIEKARKLLEKSGYSIRKPLDLTYYHHSSRESLLPKAIKMFLAKIGLEVRIKVIDDWKKYNQIIQSGETDLFLDGWGSNFADPDDFLYSLFYSGSPSNSFFYKNPQIDELLETARTLFDQPEARQKMYHRVLEILNDDVPCVPLTHPQLMNVSSNKIRNIQINQMGYPIFAKVNKDVTE